MNTSARRLIASLLILGLWPIDWLAFLLISLCLKWQELSAWHFSLLHRWVERQ